MYMYTRQMVQVDLTQGGTRVALSWVCESWWAPVGMMPLKLAQPGSALKGSQSHVPLASEHVAFQGPVPTPAYRADSAQSQVSHLDSGPGAQDTGVC